MKGIAEESLWLGFRNGDETALSALYERYVHLLFSYGMKIYCDEFLVRDCIQEVFIQLIEKRERIRITPNTHIYLFKALRNKLLEELRSKNRKAKISASIIPPAGIFEESIEQSIVLLEEARRREKLIDGALKSLSDYQREAIYLKYSQEFSYEEMAELLDIDIASVRTLLYRSLKNVKSFLSARGTVLFFFFLGMQIDADQDVLTALKKRK